MTSILTPKVLSSLLVLLAGCQTAAPNTTNADLRDDHRWSVDEREAPGLTEPWLEGGDATARQGSCTSGASGDYNYCSSDCPCDSGEGDCDSDAECASGLMCSSDVGASYGLDWYVDVCVSDCHPSVNGEPNHCRDYCPCEAGHGDCDSNAECAYGLDCVEDDGTAYGLVWYTDVCEPSCHDGDEGAYNRCSVDCPCDAGDGDCDSDSECSSGLTCGTNNGTAYGFTWYTDVCE